jgi:hypothetical protein
MRILKSGLLYFALVFGAGFIFGIIRTLWGVPRFGSRNAELMEAPFMLAVIFLAARWMGRHRRLPSAAVSRLGVGLVALGLLLTAELAVVLRLRGLTIAQYMATRDSVAGAVYLVSLVVFAVAPLLAVRR